VLVHLTLGKATERPLLAVRVWSALILHVESDGAVKAGRADLSRVAMCEPRDVSRVLTDLEHLGAVTRRGAGRAVTYAIDASFVPKPVPSAKRDSFAETMQSTIEHFRR
jgi:hypothetical protein